MDRNNQLDKEQLAAVSGGTSVRIDEEAVASEPSTFLEKVSRAISHFLIR